MILGLQILAIIFALFMIYLAVLHRRRNEIDISEYVSWVVIWALTIFVVVFPELLRDFASRFFITRLFDLMVVGGFILVIAMAARVYVKVRKMEKKFEEYIRSESLEDDKAKRK
jgi:hypothetical protein